MQLEYPECVITIDEIKAVYDKGDIIEKMLFGHIEAADQDTNITTSTENGIKRREEILKVNPKDTESIEDRRFRILIKWYDSYPYTFRDLINRMDNLLGQGNYTIVIDNDTQEMMCRLELKKRAMYDEFVKLLETIVPLNIKMDIMLRYRQWLEYKNTTWKDLKAKTWYEMRNEVR